MSCPTFQSPQELASICQRLCTAAWGYDKRELAQQNKTYTVHVLFFAVLKQLKEAAVFPEEHGCVILSQCIEHVSACCFNCVYL